jgi:hypothetical protein
VPDLQTGEDFIKTSSNNSYLFTNNVYIFRSRLAVKQENCKVAFWEKAGEIVILSAEKDLVGEQGLAQCHGDSSLRSE